MVRNTDVLVVGAGPAGVIAAITAAKCSHRVILIDCKEYRSIGDKTCGDALACERALFLKEKLDIELPSGSEVGMITDEAVLCVDDISVTLPDKQYIIDRRSFGQRLLRQAKELGVTVLAETKAIKTLTEKGNVYGVLVEDKRTSEMHEIHAYITIDCSGRRSCLRKSLPEKEFPLIETSVSRQEMAVTYREIISLAGNDPYYPNSIKIIYDRNISLPGYFWIFPKGSRTLNVGIGQPVDPKKASHNTKKLFKKVLHKYYPPGTYEIKEGRGDFVPTRYPLMNGVANGFIAAGDAALHANPFTGEGHGPAAIAGYYAGTTASKAIVAGNYSRDQLWWYNVAIIKHFAKLHAVDQLLAVSFYNFGIEKLKFILKRGILKEEIAGEPQEARWEILTVVKVLIRLFPRYDLLPSLLKLARAISAIEKLLDNYPRSPNSYERWKKNFDRKMKRIREIKYS